MFFAAPSESPAFMQWVETAKDICEILAILVGAAWTYLNYFRGRTYKPRLECSVDAVIERQGPRDFLRTTIKVRNIGLSRVQIEQKGTALSIYAVSMTEPPVAGLNQVQWNEPVAAFDLFDEQTWIEPSEPVAESMLLTLPEMAAQAYKVVLTVTSGDIWWTAETIVSDNKHSR
jgi:hypothetical protein